MARNTSLPSQLPILPLFDRAVLFPGLLLRLPISGKTSSALLSHIVRSDQGTLVSLVLGCVPVRPGSRLAAAIADSGNERRALPVPKSTSSEDPSPAEPDYGCSARIKSLSRLDRSAGTSYVLVVEGVSRFRIDAISQRYPYVEASVTHFTDDPLPLAATPLLSQLKTTATDLIKLCRTLTATLQTASPLKRLEGYIASADSGDAGQLADLCVVAFDATWEERLAVLALTDVTARLEKVLEIMTLKQGQWQNDQAVQQSSNARTKQQREFFLRQQLNAIKAELGAKDGEGPGEEDSITELQKRIEAAKPPADIMKIAKRELQRLRRVPEASSEHNVIRTYVEVLADIPWSKSTEDDLDIGRARKQFDSDHYGLEPVKKRLLEYLAILKLKRSLAQQESSKSDGQAEKADVENSDKALQTTRSTEAVQKEGRRGRAPILLLVGPPGTGKTSLAKSVATALGRKFYRISLGGVRDEAEIRGHRRTYVASLPGVIVQGLRHVGVNNPVILLDEIDKIGMSNHHGDPSAAMLEVLDPEQNHTFNDHYVASPVDLSKVLFIATANSQHTMHHALLDRMEVVEFPGYTFDEKLHIAREHLLPKQLDENALELHHLQVEDKVILKIITSYTREAGVRELARHLGTICRSKAVQYVEKTEQNKLSEYDPHVTIEDLVTILGTERYINEIAEATANPGIVTGLVVSGGGAAGGIMFIECTEMPGTGKLHTTGRLGDIMKESASIAMSWTKSNAFALALTDSANKTLAHNRDVHIHFPYGGVPKDGPSAGIGLAVALVSMFSNRAVDPLIAMTGELNLRGQVLPIGGLKLKVLAAHAAGIKTVIMPKRNERDLKEIPADIKASVRLVLVGNMWDVLKAIWPDYLKEHIGVESRL